MWRIPGRSGDWRLLEHRVIETSLTATFRWQAHLSSARVASREQPSRWIYWPSQVTRVFQSTKAPLGLFRQAQTCSSKNEGKPYRFGLPTNW